MNATQPTDAVQRRHFEAEIIVLCVRWYLRFGLSFRNLEEMMAERRTNLRVARKWAYLYRAVNSSGATIDFLLSSRRNAAAAQRFLQKALQGHPGPRVINVDGNPSYPKAIAELKKNRALGRRCRCRPVRYLNNIVEQDHRAIKRRVRASQGFRSFRAAARTIQGLEMVKMIRKGQMRWPAKGDRPADHYAHLFAFATLPAIITRT
jgi:IS6 family transposase